MSLQVWLPLNGDLKNYGINSLKTVNVQTGVSVDNNGKIGKCWKNTGTNASVVSGVSLPLVTTFSLCAWVRVDTRVANWSRSVGLFGSNQYIGLCCEHNTNTTLGFHFYKTISGTNTAIFDLYPCSLEAGVWHHYAMCYDGTKYYIYTDGVLTNSGNSTRSETFEPTALYLFGGTTSNYTKSSLNDVRFYDNCLTPKEIKEISKALVVHYPLSDQYNSSALNKYSSTYADGNSSASSWTVTKLTDEKGYNYKGTKTGNGNNSWWSFILPVFTFTAGKTYFYSLKCRCNKFTNTTLALRAARSSNDYGTGAKAVRICSSALADGQWHEYYVNQVINETYERGGLTVTCAPVLEAYTDNMNGNGTVYEMDFDLKDVQVIESDTYVPFIKNEFADATVFDISGFRNNGTRTNTTVSSDSPRYSISTVFNGTNAYIACGRSGMVKDAITVSMWCYQDSWSTFGGRPISCTEAGGWNIQPYETKIEFTVGTGTSSNTYKVVLSVIDYSSLSAGWHMFTGTYDGLVCKIYIDGILDNTATVYSTKTPIFYQTYNGLFIGAESSGSITTPTTPYFNGKASDVRIYATALSDADIKQLYQIPVSIDNAGNIYCSDFTEL